MRELNQLNELQGFVAPTRRAPLRGERHWRGAAPSEMFLIMNVDDVNN